MRKPRNARFVANGLRNNALIVVNGLWLLPRSAGIAEVGSVNMPDILTKRITAYPSSRTAVSKEAISKGIQDAMAAQDEIKEDRKDARSTSCLLWVENTILFICILVLYGWAVAIVVSVVTSLLLFFQTVRILYLHPAFIGLGHCRFFDRWLIAVYCFGLFFGLACSRIQVQL